MWKRGPIKTRAFRDSSGILVFLLCMQREIDENLRDSQMQLEARLFSFRLSDFRFCESIKIVLKLLHKSRAFQH